MSAEQEPVAAAAVPKLTEESTPSKEESEGLKPSTPKTDAKSGASATAPIKPIEKLFNNLTKIMEAADYQEMWGVNLTSDKSHVPSSIVLEKFLRANAKDVDKAKSQLTEALQWRKKMEPAKLLELGEFDPAKFGKLGYVTLYQNSDGSGKEIVTWNIYGGLKDVKETFGNVEDFIKWRCALMELSIKELDLASATVKIPEDGPDPYRMVQVHDYLNVSFFRMDPSVKAASKETIETFSMAYPELLKEKFFVNVPVIMGWVFTAMKLFLSAETVKKFHPLSYGSSLAGELPGFGDQLPKAYGGKGKDLEEEGLQVKYSSVTDMEKKKTS